MANDEAFASFERKWLDAHPEQIAVQAFLDATTRRRDAAFGALVQELSQTAFHVRESQVASAKLSWWRQELAAWTQGNARHPITVALFADERARVVDPKLWQAMGEGALSQIDANPPSSLRDAQTSFNEFFLPAASIESLLSNLQNSSISENAKLWINSHLLRSAFDPNFRFLPLDVLAKHSVARSALAYDEPKRHLVVRDFLAEIADDIDRGIASTSQASLTSRVRSRIDAAAARRASTSQNPLVRLADGLSRVRWRSLWWAWREARART